MCCFAVNTEGLWRAKANGQVPALKISFTQPWWGQLSGSVVGVGDSSATEYKHRLESVQMLNCWVSLCCGLKFFAKLGFEVVCSPKKWSTTFLFENKRPIFLESKASIWLFQGLGCSTENRQTKSGDVGRSGLWTSSQVQKQGLSAERSEISCDCFDAFGQT